MLDSPWHWFTQKPSVVHDHYVIPDRYLIRLCDSRVRCFSYPTVSSSVSLILLFELYAYCRSRARLSRLSSSSRNKTQSTRQHRDGFVVQEANLREGRADNRTLVEKDEVSQVYPNRTGFFFVSSTPVKMQYSVVCACNGGTLIG